MRKWSCLKVYAATRVRPTVDNVSIVVVVNTNAKLLSMLKPVLVISTIFNAIAIAITIVRTKVLEYYWDYNLASSSQLIIKAIKLGSLLSVNNMSSISM